MSRKDAVRAPRGARAVFGAVQTASPVLAARLADFAGDSALIEGFRAEIALWQAHGASYDYRLIVAAPA